jgi:hypothetical protein
MLDVIIDTNTKYSPALDLNGFMNHFKVAFEFESLENV